MFPFSFFNSNQRQTDFRKYFKEYVTLPEQPDSYVHYVKVNDIDGVRPKGYLLRFPFYVQGSQMAHVLLASKENPTEQDMAYEIGKLNSN